MLAHQNRTSGQVPRGAERRSSLGSGYLSEASWASRKGQAGLTSQFTGYAIWGLSHRAGAAQ